MIIGVDIDGVLADFNTAFMRLIKQTFGYDMPPVSNDYPNVWSYHLQPNGPLNKAQDDALWNQIRYSSFWGELPVLPGARETLNYLYGAARFHADAVYFITSRPGTWAKSLTEAWLERHGFHDPTVLICNSKGPVAVGLELDLFIDDRWENCRDVWLMNGDTTDVVLVDAPYNREAHMTLPGIRRVPSALDALKGTGERTEPMQHAA